MERTSEVQSLCGKSIMQRLMAVLTSTGAGEEKMMIYITGEVISTGAGLYTGIMIFLFI